MRFFRNRCVKCSDVEKYNPDANDSHVMCSNCGYITDLEGVGIVVEEE